LISASRLAPLANSIPPAVSRVTSSVLFRYPNPISAAICRNRVTMASPASSAIMAEGVNKVMRRASPR
jgi:hypothetical protein